MFIEDCRKEGKNMNLSEYQIWLRDSKNYNSRSACDASSRLRRVCRILKTEDINSETLKSLENSKVFLDLSPYVKSQLKRTVKYYVDFLSQGKGIREKT